jgi:hypothetical protein
MVTRMVMAENRRPKACRRVSFKFAKEAKKKTRAIKSIAISGKKSVIEFNPFYNETFAKHLFLSDFCVRLKF